MRFYQREATSQGCRVNSCRGRDCHKNSNLFCPKPARKGIERHCCLCVDSIERMNGSLLSLCLPPSPLPLSLKDPPNRTSPAVLGIALYVMRTDGRTRETGFIPCPSVLPRTASANGLEVRTGGGNVDVAKSHKFFRESLYPS